MNKFIRTPFAFTGDKTAIPDVTQPSGAVSYEQGFGPDYELDPAVSPSAKDVPRDETNQLFFDITTAVRELQVFYAPDFITTAQNGGTAFSYAQYARVKYTDGKVYESIVGSNTSLPTDTTKWRQVSEAPNLLVINSAVFETSVSNGEAVYWDSVNSRFDEAIADGTNKQNMIGFADVTNARVILAGEVSGLLSGLAANTQYYLSSSSAGAITNTLPADNIVPVGIARAATSLAVRVVPATPAATTSNFGLSRTASATEAQAFTAGRSIDGAALAQAFQGANQSLAAGGYQKLPGGLIFQWVTGTGTTVNDSTQSISFPVAFPNAVLFVAVSTLNNSGITTADGLFQTINTPTLSACSVIANAVGAGFAGNTLTPKLFAIGY